MPGYLAISGKDSFGPKLMIRIVEATRSPGRKHKMIITIICDGSSLRMIPNMTPLKHNELHTVINMTKKSQMQRPLRLIGPRRRKFIRPKEAVKKENKFIEERLTYTWNVQFKHYVLNIFTRLAKMNTIN